MPLENRATYDEMVAEAWEQADHQARKAGELLIAKLRDAEQAHRKWADAELETLLLAGAMKRCNDWHAANHPRQTTKDGKSVRTTGGVRRRDPETGEPDEVFEQLAFEDMGRAQLMEYAAKADRGSDTLKADADAVRRLLTVLNKVPEADTPREACRKLGIDVKAVLAGEVAV